MTDDQIVTRLIGALEDEIVRLQTAGVSVQNRHRYSAEVVLMALRISEENTPEKRERLIEDLADKLRATVEYLADGSDGEAHESLQ